MARPNEIDPESAGSSDPSRGGTTSAAVFEAILAGIVTGVYLPGARLPAERELARTLGASRPTLREALRRLTDWCLVEPRRGSGIVVRPPAEWSIEVLPSCLRHAGAADQTGSSLAGFSPAPHRLLFDLLALRRALIADIIQLAAGRLGAGDLAGAREAAVNAWSQRHVPVQFARGDFAVLRRIVEAAECFPALWLLNRLAGVYFEVAESLASAALLRPPEDYLAACGGLLDALERGDAGGAARIMREYLDRHDRGLVAAMAQFTAARARDGRAAWKRGEAERAGVPSIPSDGGLA